MRYELMRDIADGKLDEHRTLRLMVLEEDVAEVMGTLQAHFRYYREPGTTFEYAPYVHEMFTGQALMRQLLAERTHTCPFCKGEQEIAQIGTMTYPGHNLMVVLACVHVLRMPVMPAPAQ